jgi:VWFA-related protein
MERREAIIHGYGTERLPVEATLMRRSFLLCVMLATVGPLAVLARQISGVAPAVGQSVRKNLTPGNPTRLWDAVDVSLSALASERQRGAIVVFTDGDDTASNRNLKDVEQRAQAQQVVIETIACSSLMFRGGARRPGPELKNLATATGGNYLEIKNGKEVGAAFERIARELRGQYTLGFQPALADGKRHTLEVTIKQPGLIVRAQKSYLAPKGDR